jgi:inosose dehydratase
MNTTRRTFLKTAAVLAVPGFLRAEERKGLAGSQLYVWGQYYQKEGKKLEDHLDDALSALRDAGYDYAEGSLGGPDSSARFADMLRERKMKPVSLYTGGALHEAAKAEQNAEALVKNALAAHEAGFSIINCNPNPIGRAKTDEELATQAKALTLIGNELHKAGMKFGIHNHTPEMANGAKEFHSNLQQSDARTVGFCYDVHWVFRGGVMPPDALAAYGSRIVSWHLRQSREKIWWEDLDTGDVDYTYIAKYAHEHEIPPFYTVELALEAGTKITRTVVENHARSREFVRAVFGV